MELSLVWSLLHLQIPVFVKNQKTFKSFFFFFQNSNGDPVTYSDV